jgi:hypothetical protein
MKYLLIICLFLTACYQVDNEASEVKTTQEKVKAIKSKPYNELTDEEKVLLIMILESDRQNKLNSDNTDK